ncbi:MAG: fibronectin type III domain-containing protein [Pseudomonadota bacterium]
MPAVVASTVGLAVFQAGASYTVTNAVVAATSIAAKVAITAAISAGINAGADALFGTGGQAATASSASQASPAAAAVSTGIQAAAPEDVRQSVRQATAHRVRHYGQVKVSGPWVFAETKEGNFYKMLYLGEGPIELFLEYWIDDTRVNIDGSGEVTTTPYIGIAAISSRKGVAPESAHSLLADNFTEWTSSHRADGMATMAVLQRAVEYEDYNGTFPKGIHTNWSAVLRGALVKHPGTGSTFWNDNAAAVIMDFLTHEDGMRMPSALVETPDAKAMWIAAYARCDENVTLKAGGTAKRYRLWGSYSLNERPANVLSRMLACCDGRLVATADGGIGLDVGEWVNPTVTLDDAAILGVSNLAAGRDILSTANSMHAKWLNPDQDYQTADADPWIDAADVSARGQIKADLNFIMAPEHSQARRLMKLAAYRANPRYVMTLTCNLRGLAAIDQRFVRVVLADFGIDEVCEVLSFHMNVENGILISVDLQLQSMPQEAYNWDAAQEEGDAPVSTTTNVVSAIPDPTNFGVTLVRKTIGETLLPFASLSFDAPPSPALLTQAQGKKTTDSDWSDIAVSPGAANAESQVLEDGDTYEFRVRHISVTGRAGNWVTPLELDAIADPTAPDVIADLVDTPASGEVAFTWTTPNSANFTGVNIYRHTADDEANATLVRTEYGAPSGADAWTDTGLAADDYFYWFKARNASNVESASVASGSITVTV